MIRTSMLAQIFVTALVITCVSGNSFERVKFDPMYPKSHMWNYACQRMNLESVNATFLDIDYKIVTENAQVTFNRMRVHSQQSVDDIFVAYAVAGDEIASDFTYKNYSMKIVEMGVGLSVRYRVSQDILVNASSAMLVVYGLQHGEQEEKHVQVYGERWVDFGDTSLFNRSQCYDIANYVHYERAYYLNDCKIAFIVHTLFLVPMLFLSILSILTCRGDLAKRRSPTSIIGNISMICVFVISLPAYNGVSYNLHKRYMRAELSLNGWYTYCQVIGIIIGLVVALTSYLSTMLRYFHLRLMYNVSFTKSHKEKKDIPKWKTIVVSRWFYWIMFTVCITTLYIVLSGVTLALRYAHVKNLTIYSALDVVDIDFLVVLGLLLLIYIVDILVNIKQLIRKGPVNFLWHSDPLLFRLEVLIAIPFFAAMTVATIIYFKYPAIYPYARAISFDVSYFFALPLFGNGIITIIQVYRYLSRRCWKEQRDEQENKRVMIELLEDDEFMSLFHKYCKKEFSSENLEMFNLMAKIKNKGSIEFDSFDVIFQKYIKSGSNFELNLPSQVQQQITRLHAEKSLEKKPIEYAELMDLQKEIHTNLEDTFSRFKDTNAFFVYRKGKIALQKEFNLPSNLPETPKASTTTEF